MRKKKGGAKAGELTHVRQGSLEKVRLAPRPVRYPSIESGQLANGQGPRRPCTFHECAKDATPLSSLGRSSHNRSAEQSQVKAAERTEATTMSETPPAIIPAQKNRRICGKCARLKQGQSSKERNHYDPPPEEKFLKSLSRLKTVKGIDSLYFGVCKFAVGLSILFAILVYPLNMGDWTLGGTPFGVILLLSLRVAVCGAIIGFLVVEPIYLHTQKKYLLDSLEHLLEENGEPLTDDQANQLFVCIRKIFNSRILGCITAPIIAAILHDVFMSFIGNPAADFLTLLALVILVLVMTSLFGASAMSNLKRAGIDPDAIDAATTLINDNDRLIAR